MGWRLAVCRPCEIPDGEAGNEIAVTSELLLKVWRLVGWVVNGSGESGGEFVVCCRDCSLDFCMAASKSAFKFCRILFNISSVLRDGEVGDEAGGWMGGVVVGNCGSGWTGGCGGSEGEGACCGIDC